jgi:5-(carboxyamino)imidazole ribonucleotide mutase
MTSVDSSARSQSPAPAPSALSQSQSQSQSPASSALSQSQSQSPASSAPSPLVGVVMGSDSDWPVMRAAAEVLDEFGVAYEADVVSAHRMPRDMIEYGSSAESRGLRVIIAGAGGAAHLPGMLASVTPLPVIGVPVPLKNLGGLDSLLSIVQMPAGIPVATVAVGGARNAGLLAVRILGAADGPAGQALRAKLASFAERLADQARAKGAALREPEDPDVS